MAEDTFDNKVIVCIECTKPFIWNEADQKFYKSKNLLPPKRCRECRVKNKERIAKLKEAGVYE